MNSPEELVAEMRTLTKDIDKTQQEFKDELDQTHRQMEEDTRDMQRQKERQEKMGKEQKQQEVGRRQRSKTYDVEVAVRGKIKTSPPCKALRSWKILLFEMHPSSPDEEEVEEEEEEGEQPERYQVFTDGARRKDNEEQDSFMEPLMTKATQVRNTCHGASWT